MATKILTLGLITRSDEVLLGMKKRGFGAGRWNGFGGKLEPGETIEQGMKREIQEEVGVTVDVLDEVGVLSFSWEGKPDILEVHIFTTAVFSGEPIETEEMKPQWYSKNTLPFDEMWPDDKFWMPLLFAGKKFDGEFHFGEGDAILSHTLRVR